MSQINIAVDGMEKAEQSQLHLHVVFNNVPYKAGLETGCLFDTGGNGDILLSNMQRLGLDPEGVDAIVLSHIHSDHTGGLGDFLARNPDVTVYMPESFPASFRREAKRLGAATETVSGPVITGCAHPNVADMAEQAQAYLDKNIYLLMGGFHLGGRSDAEISVIINRLKALGVRKVAPSHCTGDNAIRMFRGAWGDNFVEGGLGAVIHVPQ